MIFRGCFKIARYTIELSGDLEKKLQRYMKANDINLRSVAIKSCIEKATSKDDYEALALELDKKYNRILYRLNLNKKLLEQFFANMGFQVNYKVEDDVFLKQFYQDNNNYVGKFE